MLAGVEIRVRAAGVGAVFGCQEKIGGWEICRVGLKQHHGGCCPSRERGFNEEGLRPSRASPEQIWQAKESSDLDLAQPLAH